MTASGVFRSPLPQTASHEDAGTASAIAPAVEGFRVGDRVMCRLTTHRCGACASCKMCRGNFALLHEPRQGAWNFMGMEPLQSI